MNKSKVYFLIAGEPSGDIHGANLIKSIKLIDPNSSFIGHGGDAMEKEGMTIIEHINSLAVMGFFEVLRHYPRLLSIMNKTVKYISELKPDRLILIDYPGFNLRLAKRLAGLNISITYFILPQVWAWKEKRIEIMKNTCDQLISIIPFELEWYKKRGISIDFVGHPFRDKEKVGISTKAFFKKHKILPQSVVILLLPGSRQQEIDKHIKVFLEVVNVIRGQISNIRFVLGKSSNINLPVLPDYISIEENSNIGINHATAAIVSSGTVTLECALENTPMIVCYKLSFISYLFARILLKTRHISLVNLITGEEVVPELIQNKMTSKNIMKILPELIDAKSEIRKRMIIRYSKLKKLLGPPGAYSRAAELIVSKT